MELVRVMNLVIMIKVNNDDTIGDDQTAEIGDVKMLNPVNMMKIYIPMKSCFI